ncbi:MoaD/ThiS family protein [Siculibacillus lacustris]|uniref:MoaD/ThiS family protein n=1 Tax=Siculibacillus lacustris TaxID=1549641 RepID=A0A4Q9VRA9_9HYPH|nr:MoaD/ThiS family protein [Siculibacillus lacustris]TBW38428.1 MoaD/ThiS family protein [Siculibacillus lacustris]
MLITIKLFASFRDGRFKVATREVADGATVADVLRSLEIDEPEVGMMFVRARHVDVDRVLAAGETLSVFPLVGGG